MGQHAQRFSSGKAQKGTPLYGVAQSLADIADTIEDAYDPNSGEVVRAMQYFEQGLNALTTAPENPQLGEQAEGDAPATTSRRKKSATPKAADSSENASST